GGAVLPGAVQAVVLLEEGYRQLVAVLAVHRHHNVLDKGSPLQLFRRTVLGICPGGGDFHPGHAGKADVHSPVVQIHNLLSALFEVGVVVALLHLLHRQINGDDLGQLEEGRLEDRVDPAAQTQVPGQLGGVHDVEVGVLAGKIPLDLGGQMGLQFLRAPGAVQQIGAALLQVRSGVILVHIGGGVHTDEVRGGHQVGGADGLVPEPQMALGQSAGLHRVVREVRLGILVCRQADGGDGVLVGAHGAVAAQTPDLAGHLAGNLQGDLLIGQGGVGHVVVDADGEAVLGLVLGQVVVHRRDLARRGVLGGQAVPAAHH
ncbi:Ribose transport system permease protein rbsC, partial [Dysosmobacter welbionis]